MSITAAKALKPFWYTPESQRDKSSPARFQLRALNGYEHMQALAQGVVDEAGHFKANFEGRRLILEGGIVNWENIHDEDGEPIPFNVEDITYLDTEFLVEIGNVIFTVSTLSGAERKNFISQLRSSETVPSSTATSVAGEGTATRQDQLRSSNG